jgi:hypothetical protein
MNVVCLYHHFNGTLIPDANAREAAGYFGDNAIKSRGANAVLRKKGVVCRRFAGCTEKTCSTCARQKGLFPNDVRLT